jgi:hypothetical protein
MHLRDADSLIGAAAPLVTRRARALSTARTDW